VDVEIMVGNVESGDELRNLRAWLLDEPEFRGRVTLREAPPRPGEMGPDVGALVLTLVAAGGAVLTEATLRKLGSVLTTWLKARKRTNTSADPTMITIRRPDGNQVVWNDDEVRRLSTNELAQMLDELVLRLGPSPSGRGEGEDPPSNARPGPPAG
jgi:Effector Associated Constant Component 1